MSAILWEIFLACYTWNIQLRICVSLYSLLYKIQWRSMSIIVILYILKLFFVSIFNYLLIFCTFEILCVANHRLNMIIIIYHEFLILNESKSIEISNIWIGINRTTATKLFLMNDFNIFSHSKFLLPNSYNIVHVYIHDIVHK